MLSFAKYKVIYVFFPIFQSQLSVHCHIDLSEQYKKIVLYKQDFITEIKSPYAKRVRNI